jgi:hypothetical protein
MMAATCAHVAVLTLAPALTGCSSAPPRPVYQRPVRSQYKGWTISVTPSRLEDLWRAAAGIDVLTMREACRKTVP